MQASSPVSSLSLLSSHPTDSNPQHQLSPNGTSGVDGCQTSPLSPRPPPSKLPSRSTKRGNNAATKSQKAAQLVKQELRSKLREDWSWPPAQGTPWSHQVLNLPTDERAWQERGDGFETDSSPLETIPIDPYQYEKPDDVTAPARYARPAESKKRKRQQLLLEEMGWNKGLRHFVERRNVWSGAKERQIDPPTSTKGGTASRGINSGGANGGSDVRSKRNAIHASSDWMKGFKVDTSERLVDLPSPSSPPDPSLIVTLVPFAPPILPPDNAVRASITPATYPSIYSKIVIQGLTPTVPISLHDVVGALVRGWKDNDEWPPKSDAERVGMIGSAHDLERPGELMSNEMKKGVRRRMGKVKRALHLSGTVEGDGVDGDVGVDEASDNIR